MRMLWSAALASVVLLSGCATTWIVDNDVQTFSGLTTQPSPATYRFERLPSQQSLPGEQAALEASAQPALAKAGWVRDDASPRYSVLIGTQVQGIDYGPNGRFGWGPPPFAGAYRWRGAGRGYGFGYGYGYGYYGYRSDLWDGPYYQRQVSVIIRDLSTQQVVYETRAVHSARWPGDPALLAPMFDAALSSFPQPPAGVRKVNVEVQRQ